MWRGECGEDRSGMGSSGSASGVVPGLAGKRGSGVSGNDRRTGGSGILHRHRRRRGRQLPAGRVWPAGLKHGARGRRSMGKESVVQVIARFPARPSPARGTDVREAAAAPAPPRRVVAARPATSPFRMGSVVVLAVIAIGVWALAIHRDGVRWIGDQAGQSAVASHGLRTTRIAQEPVSSRDAGARTAQ